MSPRTEEPHGKAAPPDRLVVKWPTPTEEALGTARVAGALVDRRIAEPAQIAIVAPNRLWAANLKGACESCGVKASLCIPQPALAAKLPPVPETDLKGLSLVRHLGWAKMPRMEHTILHVQGGEGAEELFALVREQLLRPTVPAFAEHIPIVLPDFPALSADYVFMVGCVRGLVPATGETETARAAFARIVAAGSKRTIASYFVKAPIELAEAASLAYQRQKTENGKRLAMLQPSPFLEEAGIWRPTTTGGQALLRTYGLN